MFQEILGFEYYLRLNKIMNSYLKLGIFSKEFFEVFEKYGI